MVSCLEESEEAVPEGVAITHVTIALYCRGEYHIKVYQIRRRGDHDARSQHLSFSLHI